MYFNSNPNVLTGFFSISGSNGSSSIVDFENCKTGIYAKGCDVEILNNNFIGCETGIFIDRCYGKNIRIINNSINCYYFNCNKSIGILLYQNDPVFKSVISNNTITILPCGSLSGCIVEAGMGNPGGPDEFLNNTLYIDENSNMTWKFGYYGNSNSGVNFGEMNTVYLPGTSINQVGLLFVNGNNNIIRNNSVFGPGALIGNINLKYPKGLLANSMKNTLYQCNYFNNIFNGMTYEGSCLGSDNLIKGNIIEDYYLGLYYNSTSLTGPQEYQGNQWLGANYYFGAVNDNPNFTNSLYKVNPISNNFMPTTPYINPNNTGWFLPGSSSNYFCSTSLIEDIETNIQFNLTDYLIAKDSLYGNIFPNILNWNAQRYLFDKIYDNIDSLPSNNLMMNFLLNHSGNSAYCFYLNSRNRHEALRMYENLKEYKILHKNLSDSLLLNLNYINNIINSSISGEDSLTIFILREKIVHQYDSLLFVLDSLSKIDLENRNLSISTLLIQNENLSTSTIYEENEKQLINIYLAKLLQPHTNFSLEQLSSIYDIAIQCPLTGGNAVFWARSLYLPYGSIVLNDDSLCNLIDISSKNGGSSIFRQRLNRFCFYPNPANESVNITYDTLMDKKCIVKLKNLVGITVANYTISLNSGKESINLKGLRPGIYFVSCYAEDDTFELGKLIIVH